MNCVHNREPKAIFAGAKSNRTKNEFPSERRADIYRPIIAAIGETEAGGEQVQGTLENLLSEKLKRRLRAWSGWSPA